MSGRSITLETVKADASKVRQLISGLPNLDNFKGRDNPLPYIEIASYSSPSFIEDMEKYSSQLDTLERDIKNGFRLHKLEDEESVENYRANSKHRVLTMKLSGLSACILALAIREKIKTKK